ncbi:MAG: GNAT family N-acetyltransferase [Candidatus Sericytochromatia bacterium]|nr:GNAT family N-acetyltransferase [Candidatus Sericytochromatia bacterium]
MNTTFIYGKPLNEREVGDYHRILTQAFGWPSDPQLNPAAEEGLPNLRLLRKSARVIGGLSFQACRQYFGGRPVSMAGVRLVAIAPDMRGQGAASTLMEAAVREQRERGWLLSTLFPEMRQLYRKAGYEVAGESTRWQVPLDETLPVERHINLKPFDLGNAAGMSAMRQLYEAHAQRTDGWLERSDWYWARIFRELPQEGAGKRLYSFLLEGGQGPEGYLIYSQPQVPGHPPMIRVRDWVAVTAAARRRLLGFFREQRATCAVAELLAGPQEPVMLMRDRAHSAIAQTHPWMLRLIDVQGALEARGYPPGLSAELHLGVKDPLLAENERPLVLTIEAGRGAVRIGGEARVVMDVRGLAALYSGYLSPYAVRGLGLLEGADVDLAKLAAAFAGPIPWMPERF